MISYIENFLEYNEYFEYFRDNLDWVQVENRPRMEYWDNSLNTAYSYGSGSHITEYKPQKNNDVVDYIRQFISKETGVFYEGCFINYYKTGRDHLGWHSDDDPSINHEKPIAIVTLGNERDFQFKKIGSKGIESINTRVLKPNSLAIMPAGMQHTHYHRIPKIADGRSVGPRISLTFRALT